MASSMKAWEYRQFSVAERVQMDIVYPIGSACHVFTGRRDSDGYGQIKDGDSLISVHRWTWEQSRGPIPEGVCVLHTCDNPSCVNIDHLWLGTHADNMRDKANKGRSLNVPSGAAHKRPMAKITSEQAAQIKDLLRRGYRGCDIAKDFGVTRNLVSEIKCGKTWAHIP